MFKGYTIAQKRLTPSYRIVFMNKLIQLMFPIVLDWNTYISYVTLLMTWMSQKDFRHGRGMRAG